MLQSQIRIAQREVDQFRESLQVIADRPRYEPPLGTLPPLDFMKQQLASAKDREEQQQVLTTAQQALVQAEAELQRLQAEATEAEAQLNKLAPQIKTACDAANQLALQWIEALQQVKALTDAASPISDRLRSQSLSVPWRAIETIPLLEAHGCKVVLNKRDTGLCSFPKSLFG